MRIQEIQNNTNAEEIRAIMNTIYKYYYYVV